ncbi:RNA-binding protein 28 [Aplochiton taeniatus]
MPALTLFVKNLPASATNASLEEVFSEIGPLKNCFVVSEKGTETCRGFGYVTFAMEDDAHRAVKELREYEGKRIIVSVAKKKIDKRKREPTEEPASSKEQSVESKEKNKGMKKLQLRSKLIIRNLSFKCTKEELKQTFEKFGKVLDVSIPLKADGKMRGFAFVLFKNMLEAGKALDTMNLKEIKGRQVAVDWAVAKDKFVATQPSSAPRAQRKPLPCDVNKGLTVFIRNLSFDTEEEGLEEVLLKYGELNYIKIVLHPDTEHSKGMAFAQFKTKEAAEKCIAAAAEESESGGVRADGRKLIVVAAVSREDAAKLRDKKVKVETGTRNLYLAREGLIRAGTKAAEGVPAEDITKRQRFEEQKRMKLRDINVFVSKTRLCVHNLPKSVDVNQLRKLSLKAAGGGKDVRITECRVMYDRKPEKGQQHGRSLGYGFVQFRNHEHALKALRHLNNNPNIHGPKKRPIVEFSLEDGKKLKLKEMRQQKIQERLRKKPALGGGPSQTPAAGPGPRIGGPGAKPAHGTGEGSAKGPSPGPGQPGKGNAPPKAQAKPQAQAQPQDQAQPPGQGGHFSGFQTNPAVEHIELEDGKKRRKVLALPSHSGPKNRLRDKGKQQAPLPKKPKGGLSRRERQGARQTAQSMEKPNRVKTKKPKVGKKRMKSRDDDRFDSLVEQYKRKLMGGRSSTTTNIKKNKWFNS